MIEIYSITLNGPDNRQFLIQLTKGDYMQMTRGAPVEVHLDNVTINSVPPVNVVISITPVPTKRIEALVEASRKPGNIVSLSGHAHIGSKASHTPDSQTLDGQNKEAESGIAEGGLEGRIPAHGFWRGARPPEGY